MSGYPEGTEGTYQELPELKEEEKFLVDRIVSIVLALAGAECRNIIGVGSARGSVGARQSVSDPRTAEGHQLISEPQSDTTPRPCDGPHPQI